MSKPSYYICIYTFWKNSFDDWFGPYPSLEAAEAALEDPDIVRKDLGETVSDVKNQICCLGIYTTMKAHELGMHNHWASPYAYNAIPAQDRIPSNLHDLAELEKQHLPRFKEPYYNTQEKNK